MPAGRKEGVCRIAGQEYRPLAVVLRYGQPTLPLGDCQDLGHLQILGLGADRLDGVASHVVSWKVRISRCPGAVAVSGYQGKPGAEVDDEGNPRIGEPRVITAQVDIRVAGRNSHLLDGHTDEVPHPAVEPVASDQVTRTEDLCRRARYLG